MTTDPLKDLTSALITEIDTAIIVRDWPFVQAHGDLIIAALRAALRLKREMELTVNNDEG